MKKTELAWAAGFFDGEGHTRRIKSSKASRRELQVAQKTVGCLERLQQALGGGGSIGGPYHTKYPVYFWYLSKAALVDKALTALWPYLSEPKKQQAIKAGFVLGKISQPKQGRPFNTIRTKPTCHPNRTHVAFGLCRPCYHKERNKRLNAQ